MKKIVILLLVSALLLCGCGTKAGEPAAKSEAAPVTAAPVEEIAAPTPEPTPEPTLEPTPEPRVECIELDKESVITHEGDYRLSGMYSDILTDQIRATGWFYYYSEGTENGAPWKEWNVVPGMYTSCKLFYTLENLGADQGETFASRFRGFLLYKMDPCSVPECMDATTYLNTLRSMAGESGAEIFDYTPLQVNPNQLDSDGYPAISLTAAPLMSGESARQDLIADIPEYVLRSWENQSGPEQLWAVFSYEESTVYLVNLRVHMLDKGE